MSVGSRKATTHQNRDTFKANVDVAVDHLSRERVLASLFSNFVFMEHLQNGSSLPEPTKTFFRSRLSSCSDGKGGGDLNSDFDRFFVGGVDEAPASKRTESFATKNILQYLARIMAYSTSTRVEHHTEKRRIAITRWFLRGVTFRGRLECKKYLTKLYTLSKNIVEFDGTPEDERNIRELALEMNVNANTDPVLEFARKER